MTYFKINDIDFSHCVNELIVKNATVYRAQTNAAGNTVVDRAKTKRIIEVGIIPLEDADRVTLMNEVNGFQVSLSFMNPNTGILEENVVCIIPESEIEYYTIRADKVMTRAYKLEFTEL